MSVPERTVQPAVFRHSQSLYDALDARSTVEIVRDTPIKVFRGSITEIYRQTGISQSYYSKVTKALADNGCITYLQRGGRGLETVVALHHPPLEHEWNVPQTSLMERGAFGILTQRLNNIDESLGGLDVKKALVDLQTQVTTLATRVDELENGRS